jgi:hypothetical protein
MSTTLNYNNAQTVCRVGSLSNLLLICLKSNGGGHCDLSKIGIKSKHFLKIGMSKNKPENLPLTGNSSGLQRYHVEALRRF